MNCLAFDVGGTTVKYGVIDRSYKVLKKDKIPTPDNEEKFIDSTSVTSTFIGEEIIVE